MTDKMTREEAIKFLTLMRKAVSNFEEYGHDKASMVIECDKAEALDLAIEALQTDAVDVYKAHEEEHLNIINRIKELQYAILGEKHQRSHGRLIDADELKKHLDGAWEELNDDGERKGVRLARWYLISAPTVDSTIDVVRCKDCVWGKEWNDKQIFCERILMRLRETDFCSYGERERTVTREEAIKTLRELWRETNDSWYEETYKVAIEALSADTEPTVIRSRTLMPIKDFKEWAKRVRETNPNTIVIPCDAEIVLADADGANLINRHDAVTVIREECWKCNNMINDDLFMRIMSLPTSRQTDCTEFIEWLVEVVMDDEDWELNAVAYGEIICRKLEKLGVLETTEEPSYYIRPSADAVQGEWVDWLGNGNEWECSVCKCSVESHGGIAYNYCPMCGARMKGGDE